MRIFILRLSKEIITVIRANYECNKKFLTLLLNRMMHSKKKNNKRIKKEKEKKRGRIKNYS